MAKTKADLEKHFARYQSLAADALSALTAHDYARAIQVAVASFKFISGMMHYGKRWEGRSFSSVETIDIVLHYAPLHLDKESLAKLETLLKTERRIDRDASDDLAARHATATSLLNAAYGVWVALENSAGVSPQRLDELSRATNIDWRPILSHYEAAGLVRRIGSADTYRFVLTTRLEEEMRGKCHACGVVVRAAKRALLAPQLCPSCRQESQFVLLAQVEPTTAET